MGKKLKILVVLQETVETQIALDRLNRIHGTDFTVEFVLNNPDEIFNTFWAPRR